MDHKREHRTPPLARVMGMGRQQQHKKMMIKGWPDNKADVYRDELKVFFSYRDELNITDELILKGEYAIVPFFS